MARPYSDRVRDARTYERHLVEAWKALDRVAKGKASADTELARLKSDAFADADMTKARLWSDRDRQN